MCQASSGRSVLAQLCLCHLISGLEATSWVSSSLVPANVFKLYSGFVLWMKVQYLYGWRHPIHLALRPGFVYNLPLQRLKAYELTFPTTLSPRHLFRLWLENSGPSQVWTQTLVMTNARQHPELLRLSWRKSMGLTQLDRSPKNKGITVGGWGELRCWSLGIARWVKEQEKWTSVT